MKGMKRRQAYTVINATTASTRLTASRRVDGNIYGKRPLAARRDQRRFPTANTQLWVPLYESEAANTVLRKWM